MADPAAARAHLAALLIRTGSEDRDAFRELYDLTSAKLFGVALRICGERAGAEDVVHEVYLLIWRRAGAWEPGRASPISWMATIARNRAIDWRRAQAVRAAAPIEAAETVPDLSPDAAMLAEAGEVRDRLLDCLARLDARTRDAIRTAFFDGLTYRELAERAEAPLATVKSWIRRGLGRLRLCLAEGDGDDR
jgi:RNA polymerase sigma factor (sigma-70 family)